jgi:uncharacterized repeat protein (TIGR02543 family)
MKKFIPVFLLAFLLVGCKDLFHPKGPADDGNGNSGGGGGGTTYYTVTFNADGGSPTPTSRQITSGNTLGTLPTAPAKSGYTFGGWFTATNGGGTQYTATSTVTGNITLYAKWVSAASTT